MPRVARWLWVGNFWVGATRRSRPKETSGSPDPLDSLDEPFRRVVELVGIDGLTYGEAAEVLDVPVGTVMSWLHRARSRIRDRLDRAGLPRSSM